MAISPGSLDLPEWQKLKPADQKYQFEQLIRYFISPLLPISHIETFQHKIGSQTFQSYTVSVVGIDFVFVPGVHQLKIGLDTKNMAKVKQTLPEIDTKQWLLEQEVAMPPMLLARTPIPVNLQAKGLLDVKTQNFFGDPFYEQRRQNDLETVRQIIQTRDVLPKVIDTSVGEARLLPGSEFYQISVFRLDTNIALLTKELSQEGMTLLNSAAYAYVTSWPATELFVKQSDTHNFFGLNLVKNKGNAEVLSDGRLHGYLQNSSSNIDPATSPFYLGESLASQVVMPKLFYRPQISIKFEN